MSRFSEIRKDFVYFGDISNAFLDPDHDAIADASSRRVTLRALRALRRDQFTRQRYNSLPGKTSYKEFLADTLAGPASILGLSKPLIQSVAPDMREYWNIATPYGEGLRNRMTVHLKRALKRGGRVMVIAHSLGSIIAYDTLWELSRLAEFRDGFADRNIDLFVTTGSPLGDSTVRRELRGHKRRGVLRYPANIGRWVNIAAHDDYVAHDQGLNNDFHAMIALGLTRSIVDKRIYNLSVRKGRSNPHHSAGYLISPTMATLVAKWLGEN